MDKHVKYIARFVVETQSALAIGAGRDGLLNERLIAKDVNGLPYIPGTSLAGVVRHELSQNEDIVNQLFGFQSLKNNEGQGSRIVFSPGLLMAEDGKKIVEGIHQVDFTKPYYSSFKALPQRDHVRINHRGVAVKSGKFEEQLVRKGTRFVFEIEVEGTASDQELWYDILRVLNAPSFRIGAGTRKGFGQLKVLSCTERQFDLKQLKDLEAYLGKSSSLNVLIADAKPFEESCSKGKWSHYQLAVKPENFFLFGSGLWDKDADLLPKTEKGFVWKEGKNTELREYYLMPATSIKGALAHRLAFHYNCETRVSLESVMETAIPESFDTNGAIKALLKRQLENDIDSLAYSVDSDEWGKLEGKISNLGIEHSVKWKDYNKTLEDQRRKGNEDLPVGENNDAVKALFGYAKSDNEGARGNVIFSDVFLGKEAMDYHYFNHVSIDRFTGGARDGALFTQKMSAYNAPESIMIDIYVAADALADEKIKNAFERTLDDLCSGNLQLGGSTTKGHGAFSGQWTLQ